MGAEARMRGAVFFDLYGTLIDILTDELDPGVYSALCRYLSYHFVNISPEEFRKTYFEEIQRQLKQSQESCPEVDVFKIFWNMMQRYGHRHFSRSVVADTAKLFRSLTIRRFGVFPGVYNVLASLFARYELAIISDAQWIFAEPEMEMLGLKSFFKCVVLSSHLGFKKPDVRLFQLAMRRLSVTPEESIYIGDNPQKDMEGAKRAGMRFVLFGSSAKPESGFKPDGYFTNYSGLLKTLQEMQL
jgi:putative hydrolase of the HAD superfamily